MNLLVIKFVELFLLLMDSWLNYRDAMSRKRPESVLSKEQFVLHGLFHAHVKNFGRGLGIILYQDYGKIKIPSHFAPASLRSGVAMIKELLDEGDWVLLIPEDLMIMARKVGFKVLPFTIPMEFRGTIMQKYICVPSEEVGTEIIKLISEKGIAAFAGAEAIPNNKFGAEFHERFWSLWYWEQSAHDMINSEIEKVHTNKKYSKIPAEYAEECFEWEALSQELELI